MHYSDTLNSWATMRWRLVAQDTAQLLGDFGSRRDALLFAVENDLLQQETDYSFSLRSPGDCSPAIFSLKEIEVPMKYKIADIRTSF